MFHLALVEAYLAHELVVCLVPHAGWLLESVQRTLELADMARALEVNISVGLLHVDRFFNQTVEKCCLDP